MLNLYMLFYGQDPPLTPCRQPNMSPDTLVNFVPNIQKNEPAKSFIKSFKLRSYKQIYEILDLYYRAHWFVRDARLCNEDTKDFNYSTIISRRSALEWIFDTKSDWDDIELST